MTPSRPFEGYCLPVCYSPRSKLSGKTYPDPEPAALRWVEYWEGVHRRTSCEAWADEDSIVSAVRQVYMQAGLPTPQNIIIAASPDDALQRWLIDCVQAAPQHNEDAAATANVIVKELGRVHTTVFYDVLSRIAAQLVKVMGSEEAFSSRRLFGAAGAALSDEYGNRWDPIPYSFCIDHYEILARIGDTATSLVEYQKGDGSSPVGRSTRPNLNGLDVTTLERLTQLSQIVTAGFPGNLAAGAYRQFAYLQTILGDQVDFNSFEPWRLIAENTHITCLGIHSVVICPLPLTLWGDMNGLTSTWDGCAAFCPWHHNDAS